MLEQIYTDFTTKLLPKIQEGLVITKDYFIDLFGRYVKYLIVVDVIGIIIGVIMLIIAGVMARYAYKKWDSWENWDTQTFFVPLAIFLLLAGGIACTLVNSFSLVKDIYIPEIRIIEKIQSMNNQH